MCFDQVSVCPAALVPPALRLARDCVTTSRTGSILIEWHPAGLAAVANAGTFHVQSPNMPRWQKRCHRT